MKEKKMCSWFFISISLYVHTIYCNLNTITSNFEENQKATINYTTLAPELDRTTDLQNKTIVSIQPITLSPGSCHADIIQNKIHQSNFSCHTPNAPLKCFYDPIFCSASIYPSGGRLLSEEHPVYGEYEYLPQDKWIRATQHGAVAFLYHPCISTEQKSLLQKLAHKCLHRYVMTPYEELTIDLPIALVSWGCYYLTSTIHNITEIKFWIRNHNHTYNGPASHVLANGKYDENLLKQSHILTNVMDDIVCPTEEEKLQYRTTLSPPLSVVHGRESIIKNRLYEAQHKRDKAQLPSNLTFTRVRTSKAVWAAASLIFLCSILFGVLLYTKMWSHEPRKYDYKHLDTGDKFEYDPGYSQFNLLKSSQKFMSMFRSPDKRQPKLDSMSHMKLMMPITEEDDEEETIFMR